MEDNSKLQINTRIFHKRKHSLSRVEATKRETGHVKDGGEIIITRLFFLPFVFVRNTILNLPFQIPGRKNQKKKFQNLELQPSICCALETTISGKTKKKMTPFQIILDLCCYQTSALPERCYQLNKMCNWIEAKFLSFSILSFPVERTPCSLEGEQKTWCKC